jgi:hypothetical protein
MSVQTEVPTIEAIQVAMAQTQNQLNGLLSTLSDPLSNESDAGGWTVRQLLSHLVGSLQRVPVHAGFILNRSDSLTIRSDEDFWIPEWDGAPLRVFQLSIEAGFEGCRSLVASLNPDDLLLTIKTNFGEMSLGSLLMLSIGGHFGHFHIPQLADFTAS